MYFNLCSLPFVLSQSTHENNLSDSSLFSPIRYLCMLRRPPAPPLLQAGQSQFSHSLTIYKVHTYICSPLISFVHFTGLFSSISRVTSAQRIKKKNHQPPPAGIPLPNAAQVSSHLLSSKGTLLIHVLPAVHQDPQGLLCQNAFQKGGSPASAGAGLVPP